MGVFTRPDSRYWYLWLETAPLGQRREPTRIVVGDTVAQKTDSRRLALQLYHTRMEELGRKIHRLPVPINVPTFNALADQYETTDLVHHKGKERELEILPRLRAHFGDWSIDQIDKDAVKAWRTARRTTSTVIPHFGGPKGPRKVLPPPSARTVNREVDVLQQVMAIGVPKYYAVSPLEGLPDLDVITPIRRLITPDEERRLLKHLARDDQAIFICGQETLARLGDILDLEKTDDQGEKLSIRDPKNGMAHEVPISRRLRMALDALPDGRASKYLFPRRRAAETERDRRNGYAKALARACQAANVPYGRKAHGVTFHWATRRTSATRLIRRGGDSVLRTVQRLGNWKSPTVLLNIYQETSLDEMRDILEPKRNRR